MPLFPPAPEFVDPPAALTLEDLPAGVVLATRSAARPSTRTDLPVIFISPADVPIVVSPSVDGLYDNVDLQIKTAT